MRFLIDSYAREAGVRRLEKEIQKLYRKAAAAHVEKKIFSEGRWGRKKYQNIWVNPFLPAQTNSRSSALVRRWVSRIPRWVVPH
jgi:ATP-dependent Lon protease